MVPEQSIGNGIGHIRRCIRLAEHLGAEVAWLLDAETAQVLGALGPDPALRVSSIPDGVDAIIVDVRSIDRDRWCRLRAAAPIIAFDPPDSIRDEADFVIDMLTPPGFRSPPNLYAPRWLTRGIAEGGAGGEGRKILISFGGEDPAGLSLEVVHEIERYDPALLPRCTLVWGPRFSLHNNEEEFRSASVGGLVVRKNVRNLAEIVASHRVVVTAYGLTAFEAIGAGVEPLLRHPSRYHRELAQKTGLRDLLPGRDGIVQMRTAVEGESASSRRRQMMSRLLPHSVEPSVITERRWGAPTHCPVCGGSDRTAIARSADRTHFRCRSCDTVYARYFGSDTPIYDRGYFFEEYRRQYGRTYLEDAPAIGAMGDRRLAVIRRHTKRGLARRAKTDPQPVTLLDIGCAYGVFLERARAAGWTPFGVDVAEDAVAYVRDREIAKVDVCDIERDRLPEAMPDQYDVVTAWYVIEHLGDLRGVLRRLSRIVRPGGLLALATPSGTGISARKDLAGFLHASPTDHVTVWSPRHAVRLLGRFGFRVVAIRSTGHHPERWFRRSVPGFLRRPLLFAGRVLRLGDTFEVYARRKESR